MIFTSPISFCVFNISNRIFKGNLSFLFLFFIGCSFAQNSGQLVEASLDIKIPFTITQFSTKQGLPQSQVLDIVAKKNGNLIIATANGIVEYNGSEFKQFISDNSYKSHIYTKLLWHDKSNSLFGQEIGGILHQLYPTSRLNKKIVASTIKNDSIYSIDNDGIIYVSEVSEFKFKKRFSTGIKNSLSLFFLNNTFFIGTTQSLILYNSITTKSQKILEDHILSIKQNPFNLELYATSFHNVYKILGDTANKVFDLNKYNTNAVCEALDFLNEEEFFVGTNQGLYEIMADYTDVYTKKSALPSQNIQSLYYNQEENCLIVGTGEKGLLKFQFKNCYPFYIDQGLSENTALSSIIRTQSGDLLAAGGKNALYKVGIDTVFPFTHFKINYSSLAEIDGIIYAGTWGDGVKLFKDRELVGSLNAPVNLPNKFVHCSFKDRRGNIWIGTSNGIAKGKSINDISPFYTNTIQHVIINFYELKNGNLCIGGSDGVYILDKSDKIITHLDKQKGLEGREVRAFYEDAEGKLWIGTYDGGLYCYFKNKLTNINKMKNAMLDNDAFCLAKDHLGYLYMTSNHGLWRIKEKDLSDFYYGKKKYLIPFFYGEETGILNTEFNGGFQNNYLKTKHNHFYFPSIQGLVIVSPEELKPRTLVPEIENIYVNDTLSSLSAHVLNRNAYSIQFKFSCVNFLNKYNLHYQYKLDNGEGNMSNTWSAPQKNRTVIFKLLPPGKYTFSVRALDAFNSPTPVVTKYCFEIKPYFYETTFFRVIAFLILLFLLFGFGLWRIKVYTKKAEEKEFYARRIAQIELKAIQAQLNPHFIFNCLNTIKYFILDNDFKKANKGLNHFSKLLRDVLDNSEKFTISLLDELTFITEYLELEKMRLQNQLQVIINNDIKNTSIIFPSMLIQPHIENAIKHGISNLENKQGVLKISFTKNDFYIECEIVDNGIGRAAAMKINKLPFHKPFGINLTKDKSEILKKIHNIEIITTITDLYNDDGSVKGTMVVIQIPHQHENRNN